LQVADLDLVVFGQGPGAFTGVRVACAVAQGLAVGLGKRMIALSSHVALAEMAAPTSTQVLVACDARMGEVYWSLWKRSQAGDGSITDAAGWRMQIAPRLSRPEAVAGHLAGIELDAAFEGVGSAFSPAALALGEALQAGLRAQFGRELGATCAAHPEAAALLAVAQRAYARIGEAATCAPEEAMPLYVRDKVALTIAERAARTESVSATSKVAEPLAERR
jgi:tRNA threonylcarbamoyladenosine biosynthesis protein TsaB